MDFLNDHAVKGKAWALETQDAWRAAHKRALEAEDSKMIDLASRQLVRLDRIIELFDQMIARQMIARRDRNNSN